MSHLPNIFGVDIAGIVNSTLGPLVFNQTLIKVTSVTDPTNQTNEIQTEVSHSCKGFVDEFDDMTIRGTPVKVTGRKIIILGASLPDNIVPIPGDKITAEGITSTIVGEGVSRDPAGATFECQTK